MDKHFITILIPLYNGIEYLEDSINSIFSQTYKNWELLIGINGRINDNEFKNKVINIIENLIKKYPHDTFDFNIINFNFKGKAVTLNNLVSQAKYDYIALLDADDIWFTDKLELQIKYLNNFDVIGTACEYIGDINNFSPNIPYGDISNFNIFNFNPILNSSVIIKKDLAYWCEDINIILEDYDLWFRLYSQSKKIYNLNNVLCYHRIYKNSTFNPTNSENLGVLKNKWLNIKYLNN